MGESNDYQYHEIRGKYHSRERWHFEFISSQPRIHHLNIWNLVCTDLQIGFCFRRESAVFSINSNAGLLLMVMIAV